MAFASSRIGAQEAIIKPCDLCEDEENVNWFCKDCDQSLCDGCKRSHLRSNVSKSHFVLSISEGFEMGKKNISNMCLDHDEPCLFLCRTCGKSICPTCLSMEHKTHDFVEMRKLHSEMQKPLDLVIKSKKDEQKIMTKNYGDLDEHVNESESYLKKRYAFIDDRVKAIKLAADDEGQKLKESLQKQMEQGNREVKMDQNKIQIHTKVYMKEIETVQRELRLQTGSSLKGFVKESVSKLESLRPMSIAVPNTSQLFTEGNFDRSKIRDMIGKMSATANLEERTKENEEANCDALSELEIISSFELKDIRVCNCVCLSHDGSIWIGGNNAVFKMSSDYSRVLSRVQRSNWVDPLRVYKKVLGIPTISVNCLVCSQSGNVVVARGGHVYIINSDETIESFKEFYPKDVHQISVTHDDRVAIVVDHDYIATFSNDGEQLGQIKVDEGVSAFCTDREGNFIIAHPNASHLTLLYGNSRTNKTTWPVSTTDILLLICDRHGNILASNKRRNIYFFGKSGEMQKKFALDCDEIRGICVNQDDRLLALVIRNYERKILVVKYLK